ncbi:hypothetical protein KKF17_01035 [Patescibacteria group bacterium]|nr:hypothetical protein [Patescibacteria group bacterium]
MPEDKKTIENRINDHIKIYPHYERILQQPSWHIRQQEEYLKEIKKINLPYLIIKTEKLPDNNLIKQILKWIDEK